MPIEDMPRPRKDQVARFAYISYLLLGTAALFATALMVIPSGGNAFYLGGYILVFATVILAPIAVALSIVRQFWGLEWRLLGLLACIAV